MKKIFDTVQPLLAIAARFLFPCTCLVSPFIGPVFCSLSLSWLQLSQLFRLSPTVVTFTSLMPDDTFRHLRTLEAWRHPLRLSTPSTTGH